MKTTWCNRRFQRPDRARRGQSLVEVALVALVVYILLAGIIEFGRLFFGAQTIQSVADFAARELSRAPLPATAPPGAGSQFLLTYYLSTGDPSSDTSVQYVRTNIYNEDYLAIDLTPWMSNPSSSGLTLLDYIDTLGVPPVNKLLLPLMFVSSVHGQGSVGHTVPLLRYPGALVTSTTAPSGYTVKVPIVVSRSETADPRPTPGPSLLGAETIVWHSVIEGIPFTDNSGTQHDVFSVTSGSTGGPAGGLAAVRVNYPFQAATMSSYPPFDPSNPSKLNVVNPNVANDTGVQASDPNDVLNGGSPVAPNSPSQAVQTSGSGMVYSGTYGGQYGLGAYGAVNLQVRPFRKTISCQAIYRREVFGPSP